MLSADEKKIIFEFFAFFGLTKSQIKLEEKPDLINIVLDVAEGETGRFIGHFATTLDSLQLILSLILNHDKPQHRHFTLDVGGYRAERLQVLQNLADQAAAQVETTGIPHSLPPLSASDRRQIHLLFQDHATLKTESMGEGQSRRLVISPKSL